MQFSIFPVLIELVPTFPISESKIFCLPTQGVHKARSVNSVVKKFIGYVKKTGS